MNQKSKSLLFILLIVDVILVAVAVFLIAQPALNLGNFAVLSPKGPIASQERHLMVMAVLIMLIAVIPVYFLIFFFAYKYRADKTESKYEPAMDSKWVPWLLWLIPGIVIFIIGIINWQSTHALDPYKPIASSKKAITIQVVALRWKWLFIYPEYNIATVNFMEFPKGTPLNFELTADDAPMNSFWIPELGGQMYAMAGMSTKLHLMANDAGEFNGSAAEINGAGLAGMRFIAKSVSDADFNHWASQTKASSPALTSEAYDELLKPTQNNPQATFSSVNPNLYNGIMMKYMAPTSVNDNTMMHMEGMGNYSN